MSLHQTQEIAPVSTQHEEMLVAIREAKRSIKRFLDAFAAPKPGQHDFHLKVAFRDEQTGEVEHIWVTDLDLSGDVPCGRIANQPRLKGLSFLQLVHFEKPRVTDWMYRENGHVVGAYTTRALARGLERDTTLHSGLHRRRTVN
ncbi:Uncharacterized conserved protein YegJ, DUF2314 family [Granulicella rosea]|uniref:Uncharacterized conserved protein YegJ, DUF2314 family n=1 Tax=Granulicella rosea TaxID=474952 RepID=A0A239DJB1_9BACT|nr:DUF2314 domain-containing protein [Granulicella rosea]SNS32540.1 Uncharacterized conserved protein YegJ, DUF2314 family [Granulicella rosea]